MTVTYELPWPVSTNQYYSHTRTGKKFVTHRGKKFQADVMAAVLEQHGIKPPLTGRIHMKVWLQPPDRRKRDVDNAGKSLLDSLTGAKVWLDDSQVDRMEFIRCEVGKPGKAVVQITEVRDELPDAP